ncbi:MAG TPA: transketolase C-terminal domain-containing protein [Candidatus Woesebacteria bacterium]|nr:transketolase C-terminal domain-containing protein [Candidatus Woesebacteria bacterium]
MNIVNDLINIERKATREGFGEAMLELGKRNKKVMVVTADLGESMKVDEFERNYPEQFVQVGVAEQNMMGVAAGLSLSGKVPFAVSYAVFNPGRNWDQLRVSVCYTGANVKIVGGHAGITVGPDGATHQALEDIAITRVLPNLMVVVPADFEQTKKATLAIAAHNGPVYLRLTRPKTACFTTATTPFQLGKAQVLREGKDISIFACGSLVYEALLAAEELKDEINIEVVNVHTIKPIDEDTLVKSAKKTGRVITLEDHQVSGGLGGAVAEVLGEKCPTKMIRMGMRDAFGESGEPGELLTKYGLDKEGVIKTIIEIIKNG